MKFLSKLLVAIFILFIFYQIFRGGIKISGHFKIYNPSSLKKKITLENCCNGWQSIPTTQKMMSEFTKYSHKNPLANKEEFIKGYKMESQCKKKYNANECLKIITSK